MQLLLEIARCPHVVSCITQPKHTHPCSEIVSSQAAQSLATHQLPEPWSGDLVHAPILFVSSNPSISEVEEYPHWDWSDDAIIDYFTRRFEGGRKQWIKDGTKTLQRDGTYARATAFWAAVRQRAAELLQRDPRPGFDYALTEVVHCKSLSERGIRKAQTYCVPHFLQRVLEASEARIIVILGAHARMAVQNIFNIPDTVTLYGPTNVFCHERYVLSLPHPNAHSPRKCTACLTDDELHRVYAFLRT